MREEIGIDIEIFDEIGIYYSDGLKIRMYRCKIPNDHINPGNEIEFAAWCDLEQIERMEKMIQKNVPYILRKNFMAADYFSIFSSYSFK